MSVRVRFAPSPTGLLHIGGARTALYCQLFAQKNGGSLVLRVEDTDEERSQYTYEESILDDLRWLGIKHHEGPDVGGTFAPYRQSERLEVYHKFANTLMEAGLAYPCFLTSEEIESLTAEAEKQNLAPHAYHGKYRDLAPEEAEKRIKAGESYVIRFKNPQESHTFRDLVRGEVTFGPDMVGDFVIIRSGGTPVYNFCCAIDDMLMSISHVIRAEEHLPNTLRQLMIYRALEHTPPVFAHVSLLVGSDNKKLSKRHGATSVAQYREQGYLPQALGNYLCLLGWSHPQERDIFTPEEVAPIFTPDRWNSAPARYDEVKLKFFNGEHMRKMNSEELTEYLAPLLDEHHPFHAQDIQWKHRCVDFFKNKFDLPREFTAVLDTVFGDTPATSEEYAQLVALESTATIKKYLRDEVEGLIKAGDNFVSTEVLNQWQEHIKSEFKIKGKALFKGVRACLTLADQGPDLQHLLPLTPLTVLEKRLSS